VQGFGTPPEGPRRGHILGQAAQLLVSLAAPAVVLRLALPRKARRWLWLLAMAAGVSLAAMVLGLSIGS
jgi:hypothetical protein